MEEQAKSAEKPAEQPKPAVRIAKQDAVLTIFADGMFGAQVSAGVARLELFADHYDPAVSAMQPTIVGRLVMPVEKLELFARATVEVVQRLQREVKEREAKAAAKS